MSEKRKILIKILATFIPTLALINPAIARDFTTCKIPQKVDGTQDAYFYDPIYPKIFQCKGYKQLNSSGNFSCTKNGDMNFSMITGKVGLGYKILANGSCVKNTVSQGSKTSKTSDIKTAQIIDKKSTDENKTVQANVAPGANTSNVTGNASDLEKCVSDCLSAVDLLQQVRVSNASSISAIDLTRDASKCSNYVSDPLYGFKESTRGVCQCQTSDNKNAAFKDDKKNGFSLLNKMNENIEKRFVDYNEIARSYSELKSEIKTELKTKIDDKCKHYVGNGKSGENNDLEDCTKVGKNVKCSQKVYKVGKNGEIEEHEQTGYIRSDGTFKIESDKTISSDSKTEDKDYKYSYKNRADKITELKEVNGKFYEVDSNGNLIGYKDKSGNLIVNGHITGEVTRNLGDGTSYVYNIDSSGKKTLDRKVAADGSYLKYEDKDGNLKVVKYDSKGNRKYQDNDEGRAQERRDERKQAKIENDPCRVSASINERLKCRGTQTMIDISNTQAQVTQLAGAAGVQISGRNAVNQYQQTGRMSDAYQGAADSIKTAKGAQIITGVVNAAAFTALKSNQKKHERNRQLVEGYAAAKTEDELKAIAAKNGLKSVDGKDIAAIREAQDEQTIMAGKAKERATVHAFQGAVAIAQAVKLGRDQKMARDYANRLAEQEKKNGVLSGNPLVVKDDPNGDSSAITGNDGGNTSVTGVDPNGNPNSGLGDGLGLGGDGGNMGGPPPGAKTLGGGGAIAGGAGGGGGGLGGGGAAVAPPDMTEGKAQPAEITEAKDRFEMGGGAITQSGGKAGGGGNDGGGLDFNNLLAQFLPKDEPSQQDGANNGILSYDGAAQRGIASVEQNNYLDQKTDIFDRLHKKYHGLAEAKRVSAE